MSAYMEQDHMAEVRTHALEPRDSAVQMVKDQGMSVPKAAAGLGSSPYTLHGWIKAASGAKPSASTRATHRGTAGSDTALQQRVRELEAENHQLRVNREIH